VTISTAKPAHFERDGSARDTAGPMVDIMGHRMNMVHGSKNGAAQPAV
jgi:hypothetical protein